MLSELPDPTHAAPRRWWMPRPAQALQRFPWQGPARNSSPRCCAHSMARTAWLSARELPNIPAPSATYAIRPRMPCHAVHASPIALLQGSRWLCRFVDTACDAAAAAALKGATACEFFATPVVIGRTGVVKNLGLGNLSEYVRSPPLLKPTPLARCAWVKRPWPALALFCSRPPCECAMS